MLLAAPAEPMVVGEHVPPPEAPPAAQAPATAPQAPLVDPRFPVPEGGFLSPLGPIPEAQAGYLYRATNLQSAAEMAEYGLGLVEDTWGDGIKQARAYFYLTPGEAGQRVPNDGTPVLIRVPARGVRREPYTGALYRTEVTPAREVEILGADGTWYPLRTETDAERDERVRYEAALELVPERPKLVILKESY